MSESLERQTDETRIPVPAQMSKAIAMIVEERKSQDQKWGNYQQHPVREWLAVLLEELGEVAQRINDDTYQGSSKVDYFSSPQAARALRDEIVQVAAVAAAWLQFGDFPGA